MRANLQSLEQAWTEHVTLGWRRGLAISAVVFAALVSVAARGPRERYDVALSYACENLPYVQEVADSLWNRGGKVYLAADEICDTDGLGRKLSDHLVDIFAARADYVVAFISKDYVVKSYPMLELTTVLRVRSEKKRDYLLPVILDGTIPRELADTEIKYKSARGCKPACMARVIEAWVSAHHN
jgi:hypothetical protein